MKQIHITIPGAPETAYPILIGRNLLQECHQMIALGGYSRVFVVTDENVAPHWLAAIKAGCGALPVDSIVLPAGEAHKDMAHVAQVWEAMRAAGCDRKSLVLDVGGGVVGDLGGFAACTYMRGVDFVQVPTTLLSMVDASVGGKLGFNLGGIKNLIGVFQQPQAVLIDLETLTTLPERELRSGLAEVLKHGLIRDHAYFSEVCALVKLAGEDGLDSIDWADVVARSCEIKAAVVQADEREGGVRKILNFGHTAGHAIESLMLDGPMPLLHGEAIALGMFVEAEMSRCLGHISEDDVATIEAGLHGCGLPIRLPTPLPLARVFEKMRGDKKNVAGEMRWSLLGGMGEGIFDVSVEEAMIMQGLAMIGTAERMGNAGGPRV